MLQQLLNYKIIKLLVMTICNIDLDYYYYAHIYITGSVWALSNLF